MKSQTLIQLLADRVQQQPESIAIEALDRDPLTYRGLYRHVISIGAMLNQAGIGRNDRVAIVAPNGPEMATAFLSVAAGATSAPLNPQYRAAEFDFYLSDLKAKALIIQADLESEARTVALDRGIPIIDLVPRLDCAAGQFELLPHTSCPIKPGDFVAADDIALVLHTSGTTSRPKLVPLTQANICASALHVSASLQLSSADRCLNVMPLFHIHGLIAAVLASLSAGGSVLCTPGFQAPSFFEWFDRFRPTWYTAVPTMHQVILARAGDQLALLRRSALRFIRSSSASLAPVVMNELERTFKVPVIEAYGMTEAAHQMASNPLPPLPRKAGSVG
ncbi:MAG TPA: AMP-binding protein, partial [Anaerolineae bacterium]|nr:AMP-binding protein [Anaerolineae bacterium]